MFWGEGTACAKAWVKGKNSTLYPSPPSTLCDSCSSPALAPIQLTQAPVPTASPWPVSSGAGARLGFWAEQRGEIQKEEPGQRPRAPARAGKGRGMGRIWS